MSLSESVVEKANVLLARLFKYCENAGASDIHIASGLTPRMRVQGSLWPLAECGVVAENICEACGLLLASNVMPPDTTDLFAATRRRLFAQGAIDGSATSATGHRYRFNVFRESNNTAISLRRLDDSFQSLEELGLPLQIADFCDLSDGLVVITGPTGSGKSTTLATLIDQINNSHDGHIITIEDPIEYIHQSRRCLVRQRQVGRDSATFYTALVDSLRQDPDVILVGEVREVETIRTAITAAETGHLVFTTLHAGDCVGAIERLVAVFSAGEQESIRRQIALVLKGVMAQHLLPNAQSGARRVACTELLLNSPAIANLIANGKSAQIYSMLEMSGEQGMVTLENSLARLLRGKKITEQTAMTISRNPAYLKKWLQEGGGRSNS